jgi:hypothetical protein
MSLHSFPAFAFWLYLQTISFTSADYLSLMGRIYKWPLQTQQSNFDEWKLWLCLSKRTDIQKAIVRSFARNQTLISLQNKL